MIFHTNLVIGKYISFLAIRLSELLYPDFSGMLRLIRYLPLPHFFASQVGALTAIFPFSRCYKTLAFLNLLVASLYGQCVRLLSSGICTRFSGWSLLRDFMKTTMSKVRTPTHTKHIKILRMSASASLSVDCLCCLHSKPMMPSAF